MSDCLLDSFDNDSLTSPVNLSGASLAGEKGKKVKTKSSSSHKDKDGGKEKRSRGRPRLTDEEKQRRKELRELGLMKRSKRRTKERMYLMYLNRLLFRLMQCTYTCTFTTMCTHTHTLYIYTYTPTHSLSHTQQKWQSGANRRSFLLLSEVVSQALERRTLSKLPLERWCLFP